MAVGGVVSAATKWALRAAAPGRAAGHSRRTWRHWHVVRRRRLRARHPPCVLWPRQERQRFRHRPARQGSLSPLAHRPGDAEDPADIALPRPARAVLRRPRGVAVSPIVARVASARGELPTPPMRPMPPTTTSHYVIIRNRYVN